MPSPCTGHSLPHLLFTLLVVSVISLVVGGMPTRLCSIPTVSQISLVERSPSLRLPALPQSSAFLQFRPIAFCHTWSMLSHFILQYVTISTFLFAIQLIISTHFFNSIDFVCYEKCYCRNQYHHCRTLYKYTRTDPLPDHSTKRHACHFRHIKECGQQRL